MHKITYCMLSGTLLPHVEYTIITYNSLSHFTIFFFFSMVGISYPIFLFHVRTALVKFLFILVRCRHSFLLTFLLSLRLSGIVQANISYDYTVLLKCTSAFMINTEHQISTWFTHIHSHPVNEIHAIIQYDIFQYTLCKDDIIYTWLQQHWLTIIPFRS